MSREEEEKEIFYLLAQDWDYLTEEAGADGDVLAVASDNETGWKELIVECIAQLDLHHFLPFLCAQRDFPDLAWQ